MRQIPPPPDVNSLLLVLFLAFMPVSAYVIGSILWDIIFNGELCTKARWSASYRCVNWKTATGEMVLTLITFSLCFAIYSIFGIAAIAELFRRVRKK